MLLTRETVPSTSSRTTESANQPQGPDYLAGSFVIREVPVTLIGTESLATGKRATLHYAKLQIEGVQSLIPESIEVDIRAISDGGQIRVDELPMPPCCEVIGVWFANPVVTVSSQE